MRDGAFNPDQWAGPEGEIGSALNEQTDRCLRAYTENPLLIEEHANIERATAHGGYGRRQIYELIQNGADELITAPKGRIHVLLTEDTLYCANEGTPIHRRGVQAILSAALSVKRGDEIGRFGLGFKSVLGVTDLPDFFSRTGSFRFDADWARKKILAVKPDAERTPILRVAYPLDPEKATRSDQTLSRLMAWATTVVRLPIVRGASQWLPSEIEKFPAEFLLFSPHVGELILEDTETNVRRTVHLESQDSVLRITEAGETTSWNVFKRVHRPSQEARKEAGELADRETIPIVWAVPTEGRRRTARGTLWAFFPTHYQSTLSGILNAPWKTNEDRQNLLEGPFNEELLEVASGLVVQSLDALAVEGDPAAHLDVMPARGKEAPNWADELLTEAVYRLAAQQPSLPDQHGQFRRPAELACHPAELKADALEEWASYPGRPVDWCHSAIQRRERRPRAERLLSEVGVKPSTLETWLEALADDGSPQASIAALKTAKRALIADANALGAISESAMVLTAGDELWAPDPDLLSLPGEYESADGDMTTVHPEVLEDREAMTFLLEMGLREADSLQEVRSMIALGKGDLGIESWEHFWRLLRQAGHQAVQEVLVDAKNFSLHALTADGEFRPIVRLLLPGPVVSEDAAEDRGACVDTSFHSDDIDFLQALGVSPAPRFAGGSQAETFFKEYVRDCRQRFLNSIDRNPGWDFLVFKRAQFAGPLTPLKELSPESAARFTEAALEADPQAASWVMYHRTRSQEYPRIEMQNPMLWLIERHGVVHTSLGVKSPTDAIGPQLRQWSDFFPVASIAESSAQLLDLPESLDELASKHWTRALRTATGIVDDRDRGRFYVEAARFRGRPAHILCRVGKSHQLEEPTNVTAVSDEREMLALAAAGTPVLLAPAKDISVLIEKWGLISGHSRVKTSIEYVEEASPIPIADRWPLMALALPSEYASMEMVSCETLRLVTRTAESRREDDIRFHREDVRLLYISELDEYALLRRISDEFELDLSNDDLERIVEQRVEDQRRNELNEIAEIDDPGERLLQATGPEAIRRILSPPLLDSAERILGEIDDRKAAELALASFGVNTLKVLRDDMAEWTPPTQWAGSRRAREFVTSFGFGPEYAGFPTAQRDPLVTVDGPLTLPPLHDFQSQISEELRKVLQGDGGTRGLVSLPTGAGKTRVVVQTMIEAVKSGDLNGPLLWIAQSDELCEQAVQSWIEVWRALGPESRMYVSRLWGNNEVSAAGSGFQVVIATIDKLRERITGRPDYEWLRDAECIIVDEAHGSITPEYTRLLEAFGMGRGKERIPLIGLTATPFRGDNEPETRQLASRYGSRLLDEGVLGDNPYEALQKMKVLAEVEHQILPGSEISLSDDERQRLEVFGRVPPSVEGRLGADPDRNEMLLESILDLPDDWTILLFAASVQHAQTMAALLHLSGVPAAAISGETEAGARRHYVEEFRKGRIRVLTNYAVLTQGFDAPAVRAVYVARPTFSPNLYQQMIGRGLRGPLNGGGDVCRIVNVADNFLMFGEELAFHRFDYLWNRTA